MTHYTARNKHFLYTKLNISGCKSVFDLHKYVKSSIFGHKAIQIFFLHAWIYTSSENVFRLVPRYSFGAKCHAGHVLASSGVLTDTHCVGGLRTYPSHYVTLAKINKLSILCVCFLSANQSTHNRFDSLNTQN